MQKGAVAGGGQGGLRERGQERDGGGGVRESGPGQVTAGDASNRGAAGLAAWWEVGVKSHEALGF